MHRLTVECVICLSSGCDPLTAEDIAEVIVFTAGRPENVVIADTLIYPQHQVSAFVFLPLLFFFPIKGVPGQSPLVPFPLLPFPRS